MRRIETSPNSPVQILIVDDDIAATEAIEEILKPLAPCVLTDSSEKVMAMMEQNANIRIVISDVDMPGRSGLDLLKEIKSLYGDFVEVIMFTGTRVSIVDAVESIRLGAYNYFIKPVNAPEIRLAIEHILQQFDLQRRPANRLDNLLRQYSFSNILGRSELMKKVFALLKKLAQNDSPVLIQGETGTGKELAANAIHFNSRRSEKPFLKVNCAAIPETLMESTLFGHDKGAFTGADHKKEGLFDAANHGTLFLDEIGDMPASMQVKLLRVLESGEFTPVGSTETHHCDVRIIAATNRSLKKLMEATRNANSLTYENASLFREDLFYRISTFSVHIPPLRERKGDIAILAEYFINALAIKSNSIPWILSPEALEKLQRYSWPGNIRELKNVLERAALLSTDKMIGADSLQLSALGAEFDSSHTANQPTTLDDMEKKYIRYVMELVQGNKTKASQYLNIKRDTLYRKLKKYDLE